MKKVLKKSVSLILALLMVLSAVGTAFADDPEVTFDNMREPQPDLYVTKSVSSALDGYTIPDAEFTFILRWDKDGDGELEYADNEIYGLFDEAGNQIYNDSNSSYIWRTSSTGEFTLKAGQYAWFEFVGEGVAYEITEITADGFIQIAPAGGSAATGTVPEEGVVVEFENLYVPVTETEETMLAIRKDILWPDGLEVPEYTEDEFTFSVSIDGSAYGNQIYTIYDADMNEELGRGTTATDGTFSILGGQTALFENIEVGVDYVVQEVTDGMDGWQAVGTTEYHGSTVGPIIYAYFTNEPAWFTVEKERSDGVTGLDDEFTFTLTDGTDPVSGAEYYIYDENGNFVGYETDDGTAYIYTTDESGQFTLKAGEKALFVGLPEGTAYTVTESAAAGYEQVTSGTQNVTPEFDGDSALFINGQLTDITIKKARRDNTDKLLGGAEFTIYRLKDGADADSSDMDNWEEFTGFTNSNGSATLTTDNDENSETYGTVTFEGLPAGTYMIKETKAPEGYSITGEPIIVTVPYTMTEEEVTDQRVDTNSPDWKGIWSERDGEWYLYELTYDVLDTMSLLELPHAGGTNLWWLIPVGIGVVLIGGGIYYLQNRRTAKANAAKEDGEV